MLDRRGVQFLAAKVGCLTLRSAIVLCALIRVEAIPIFVVLRSAVDTVAFNFDTLAQSVVHGVAHVWSLLQDGKTNIYCVNTVIRPK